LEEVPLPGTKLYFDFLVPSANLAVEVQGEQHYKFNSFFHKHKAGLLASKSRDRQKREWCELNGITLLEFPYNESDEQWKLRITEAFQ
jgi:very-short-patch-repair endonuclease